MTGKKSGDDILEDVFGSDWGSDNEDDGKKGKDLDDMARDEADKRRARRKEDVGKKKRKKKKPVESDDEYSEVESGGEKDAHAERKSFGGKSVRKMKRKKEESEKKEEKGVEDEFGVDEDEIVPVRKVDEKVRKPIVFSDDDADDEEDVPDRKADRKRKAERVKEERDEHDDDLSDLEEPRRDHKRRVKSDNIRIKKKARLDDDDLGRRSTQPSQDDHFVSDDEPDDRARFDDEEDDEDAAARKSKRKLSAFEEGVQEIKALRRPRKKEVDPSVIESECVAFLEKMMKARDDDLKAYKSGKPALEKLKMLRSVELMLMKVQYREQLMDNMLLAIIKAWLDPMPDGALPNLEIRTSLLNILYGMRVDSDWVERLHSSQGLGRVVHYLSRSESHLPNRRLAEKIMRKWARPVYNSNANFHDLLEEFNRVDHVAPKDGVASERQAAREAIKNFKTSQEKIMEFKKRPGNTRPDQIMATVPRRTPFLFTTLAEGVHGVDEKHIRELRAAKARNKRVNRTMATLRRSNKQRNARAAKPSLTGRR